MTTYRITIPPVTKRFTRIMNLAAKLRLKYDAPGWTTTDAEAADQMRRAGADVAAAEDAS